MTLEVFVTDVAEAHIVAIDEWWRENRGWSANLFVEELSAAFVLLSASPQIGKSYSHPKLKGIRRVLLRTTRNHVYYRADEKGIWVLAVWSGVRGAGPELG